MRQLLFATMGVAAITGSALGADLPSAKSAPAFVAPAPVYNWTGFYAGVYGGGVFSSANVFVPVNGAHYNQNPAGGAFGGLVGYNHQFNPNWVVGLEGDGGWQGFHTRGVFIAPNGNTIADTIDSDYAARLRGRLGYAINNALFFVAGGASFSDISLTKASANGLAGPYTITHDYVGWNIGGGVDYAFAPNWIGRVEYVYDEYGAQTYAFLTMPRVGNGHFQDHRVSTDESTVRAALIYRFGAPESPVVAKY